VCKSHNSNDDLRSVAFTSMTVILMTCDHVYTLPHAVSETHITCALDNHIKTMRDKHSKELKNQIILQQEHLHFLPAREMFN